MKEGSLRQGHDRACKASPGRAGRPLALVGDGWTGGKGWKEAVERWEGGERVEKGGKREGEVERG